MTCRSLRWTLVLLAAGGWLLGQQQPVAGYFCDGQGALRALVGVPGNWQAPIVVPEGVLSAGYNGRLLWYKTEHSLWIRSDPDEWLSFEAPSGPAKARFDSDGQVWLFWFPASGGVAVFDPAAGELRREVPLSTRAAEPDWPEQIGPELSMERRDSTLLAKDSGGRSSLLPLAETPVFQLFLVENGTEKPVGTSFVMPPAAPGESSTARFRVRNTGQVAVVITRLSIDPSPFKTFDQFFPPRTIAPGDFADFWIRFSPTTPGEFRSTLYINDLKITLSGSSQGLPVVELENGSGWQTLKSDSTASLGTVERRTLLTRRVRVTPVVPLVIAGVGFELQPESEPGYYTIRFTTDQVGVAKGQLIEGQRTFPLEVTVTDFPTPTPSIEWLDEPGAARQIRFRVKLSEAARTNLLAAVSLSFLPDTGLPDDSAVLLLPNSIRTIPLTIREGSSASDELVLQSGTTAGLVQLRVSLGNRTAQASFRISPLPVTLTDAKASAASANAEVVLTGYDTVRSASRIAFTFYLKSGQTASPGRIEVDISSQFADYYRTTSGSAFRLRAHFPVSGTHTELDSVEVEVFNSTGRTSTGRLRFE